MMSFSSNFIKKKKGRWHYYPYGHVMEDISMPIYSDKKEYLENCLDQEMPLAMASAITFAGLASISLVLAVTMSITFILYIGLKRRIAVKKSCEFINYPISIYLKNYHKINVTFGDPTSFIPLCYFLLIAVSVVLVGLLNDKESYLIYIGGIWGLLNVYALFVCYPNWKKASQKSTDKRLQETKVSAFRLFKTYLFLPLVIVLLIILTLHFIGS
jgi:hypothetical protein